MEASPGKKPWKEKKGNKSPLELEVWLLCRYSSGGRAVDKTLEGFAEGKNLSLLEAQD